MKFIRIVKWGVGVMVLAGVAREPALAAEAAGPGRPNVILCMTDDQGWNDVSYNERGALARGKVRTPNLDAMAAAGLRFDRFYAAAPVCSPTRGSCLTGRHPYRYGVRSPGQPIKRQEMSIAQALQQAGYATAHFGKWHLNGVSGPGKPIALSDNRYKLVVSREKGKGERESVALYDLVEDLGERKNLAAEQPTIVAKMRPALDAWRASVDRSANGGDYAGPQR
jgi:hypothetical protein